MSHRRIVILLIGLLPLALAACGDDGEPAGGSSPGETTIQVTLQEYSVLASPTQAPAGKVTFSANNKGPALKHELVVVGVQTSTDPAALPKNADGSVNESGAGVTTVGEIEEFAVGETKSITFTLAKGSYVLFCNVVGTEGAHYTLGMRTAFGVT